MLLLQEWLKGKTVPHLEVGFQALHQVLLVVHQLVERLAFVDYLSVECDYVEQKKSFKNRKLQHS